MSKLLVVFGATGQQGGSLINYILNDATLSKQYKLRGITRSSTSSASQTLHSKGVEIVQADAEDTPSLATAVQNAHTVFINTVTRYDERMYEREVSTGKAIADASVAAGATYLIYSTSTPAHKFTGRPVASFDSKYVVEEYIRTLPVQSAFFAAAAFMQNYHGQQRPQPTKTGGYAIYNFIRPDVAIPLIEITGDSGKYLGAILAEPEKYHGKVLYATSEMLTGPEIASALSESSGKKVEYVHLTEEQYGGFLPERTREHLCAMMAYMDEPGYYGPETAERVKWTMEQARGKLTTYREFLKENPMVLE